MCSQSRKAIALLTEQGGGCLLPPPQPLFDDGALTVITELLQRSGECRPREAPAWRAGGALPHATGCTAPWAPLLPHSHGSEAPPAQALDHAEVLLEELKVLVGQRVALAEQLAESEGHRQPPRSRLLGFMLPSHESLCRGKWIVALSAASLPGRAYVYARTFIQD